MRYLILAVCVWASACATTSANTTVAPDAATAPVDYAIKLERESTVGRGHLVVETRSRERSTVLLDKVSMAQPGKDKKTSFDAVQNVRAVGEAADSEFVVQRFEVTDVKGTEKLAETGQVIRVQKTGENREVTLDGRPASPTLITTLDEVLHTKKKKKKGADGKSEERSVGDDDVFGTDQRRKVGDAWPINADVAASDLRRDKGVNSKISGQTKLVRTVAVHGIDCLEIKADMNADVLDIASLPPGFDLRKSTLRASFSGLFPIDVKLPKLDTFTEFEMSMTMSIPAGPKNPAGTMEVVAKQSETVTFEPLP